MPDLRETDVIICLHCHWNGEVEDLKPRPVSPREEDSIDFMECPNCREALAIRGWIDFIIIPMNAVIRTLES